MLLILIFPAACVLPPKHISAKQVPPEKYQEYTCEQIKQELFVVDYKLFQITRYQNARVDERDKFLASTAFPMAFFVDSKNEEIAQLKGEYEALEVAANQKECNLDVEVEEINTEQIVNEND